MFQASALMTGIRFKLRRISFRKKNTDGYDTHLFPNTLAIGQMLARPQFNNSTDK
jgi:hypothetical protein